MSVLLQPSSGKEAMNHFEDTIVSGVPLLSLKNKILPEEYEKLSKLGTEHLKVWGFVPELAGTARGEWIDLNEGDFVLFYAKKSFYYAAVVYLKIHNAKLAQELWGNNATSRTWEYMYFIKEGKQVEIPYNPELLGYSPKHRVMGAMLLKGDKAKALEGLIMKYEGGIVEEEQIEPTKEEEERFYEIHNKVESLRDISNEIYKISEEIKNKPAKERIRIAKLLVRNPKFARLVKEKAKYICEICGNKPFMQKNGLWYAEAHHKFELAKTRMDNPKDMVCVCPTCHKIIHYGTEEELLKRSR